MSKKVIITLIIKTLNNYRHLGMLRCMDLILDQPYLNILQLLNKLISIQFIEHLTTQSKNKIHQDTLLRNLLTQDNQQAILILFPNSQSELFQIQWVKIRNKQETRNKEQVFREAGCPQEIQAQLIQWVKQQKTLNIQTFLQMISKLTQTQTLVFIIFTQRTWKITTLDILEKM